jgi:hypothetical protein
VAGGVLRLRQGGSSAARWLREPILWFLLLSAGVFAVYPLLGARSRGGGDPTIRVLPNRVRLLVEGFRRTWQRDPTAEEVRNLVEDDVRTEILAREAIAMGLDRDDSVIRRQLRMKLEAIAEDAARREPTEPELSAFLAANPERFRDESRLSFRQVFLSPDLRGDRLEADAGRLLAELNGAGVAADITTLGDSLMLEPGYENLSTSEVARTFGPEFATAVAVLPVGTWRGPISSAYGAHLVVVTGKQDGRKPRLNEVRQAVRREWEAAQVRSGKDAFYARLRSRYHVRMDLPTETVPARASR